MLPWNTNIVRHIGLNTVSTSVEWSLHEGTLVDQYYLALTSKHSPWKTLIVLGSDSVIIYNHDGIHPHCHKVMETLDTIRKIWLFPYHGEIVKIDARYNLKDVQYNPEMDHLRDTETVSDPIVSTFKLVMAILQCAQDTYTTKLKLFAWTDPTQLSDAADWPAPNFTWPQPRFHEATSTEPGNSTAAIICNVILSAMPTSIAPGMQHKYAELDNMRYIGSHIAAALYEDHTHVTVHGRGDFILGADERFQVFTALRRFPQVDIFSQYTVLDAASETYTSLPLVLTVAVAKSDAVEDYNKYARSQMMEALHPTMNIMLAYYLRTAGIGLDDGAPINLNDNDTSQLLEKTAIPVWLFAYGIYYDDTEARIYAHFPVIETRQFLETSPKSNTPISKETKRFSLRQVELFVYKLKQVKDVFFEGDEISMHFTDGITLSSWFRFAIVLATVRRHQEKLVQEMSSFLSRFRIESYS